MIYIYIYMIYDIIPYMIKYDTVQYDQYAEYSRARSTTVCSMHHQYVQ